MKLTLTVDALSPNLSGIGRYTWELAQRVCQFPIVQSVNFYRFGRRIKDLDPLLKTDSPGGVRAAKMPPWAERWYWRNLCRGQVFHSTNYFLPSYAENGVVSVHDLSVFKFPEMHPVERVRQFEKNFRATLDIAKHLITDTETIRQEVIDFLGWPSQKVSAIHLGVSPAFAPRSEGELTRRLARFDLRPRGYLLCVSTVEPRKGIGSLLDAYEMLDGRLKSSCPLVLVGGRGWLSDALHSRIVLAEDAGWLRYYGFVLESDLSSLYAGARLFVYPSSYEGFGLPVAEAMASGVPVVTSNRSCLPEISAGAAKLVNPDDVDMLAACLAEGLADFSWRKNAISRGLEVAARYDWNRCVENTVAVYSGLSGD